MQKRALTAECNVTCVEMNTVTRRVLSSTPHYTPPHHATPQGKSTLLNTLLGVERVVTGPQPGLTRDPVAVVMTHSGRRFQVVSEQAAAASDTSTQ
jgi:hypothetical protein